MPLGHHSCSSAFVHGSAVFLYVSVLTLEVFSNLILNLIHRICRLIFDISIKAKPENSEKNCTTNEFPDCF